MLRRVCQYAANADDSISTYVYVYDEGVSFWHTLYFFIPKHYRLYIGCCLLPM